MGGNAHGREQGQGRGEGEGLGRDLDAETDELLNSIESQTGSMYAVHTGEDAEEFDPGNLHAGDLANEGLGHDELAHAAPIDEPPEDAAAEAAASDGVAAAAAVATAAADEDAPVRDHRGLKRALVIIVIVLALIVCTVGVLIWHNSISPDVKQADTEALVTNQAGTNHASFQKVSDDKIPQLAGVFGLKQKAAEKELGAQFQASGKAKKTKDKRVKSMKKLLEGNWLDGSGKVAAGVGLGLDKKGRVVYAYALYNLDTIGVADASFAELVKSDVVAKSVLSGMGVSDAELDVPQLAVDGSSKETATFKAATSAKKAPKTWELAETYAYDSSNATTRTLLAELY